MTVERGQRHFTRHPSLRTSIEVGGICRTRRGLRLTFRAALLVLMVAVSPMTLNAAETYSFGRTSFTSEMWINGGAIFKDVRLVEVEMISNGAFRFEVVDPSGKILSTRTDKNGAGWHTFSFSSGMGPPPGPGPYKLRFVNVDPGERQIKSGNVVGK